MPRDKIDFQQKFYVRLEDEFTAQFVLDQSQLDMANLDPATSLLERVQASNNRRLRGEQ